MNLRPIALLFAAALMLIGAGCGGNDEANEYIDEVNTIQQRFVNTIQQAGSEEPGSPEEAADALRSAAEAANTAADELEGLEPPDDVTEQNSELAATYREAAEALEGAVDAVEGAEDDPEAALEASQEVQQRLTAIGERADEIIDQIADELGTEATPIDEIDEE